jgi:dTDP-4-dehydrorhamnose reductase
MTRAIEFIESGNDTTSHVGGGSWLPSNFPWPMCEGKKMIPFMTIFQDIFITPTIPNDMAITVFTPIDLNTTQIIHQVNQCRIQNESECNNHNDNMGMRVILHEISGKELIDENITTYPKVFLKHEILQMKKKIHILKMEEQGRIILKTVEFTQVKY